MSQLVEPNAIEEKMLVQLVVSKGRELSYKNIYIELGGFVSVFYYNYLHIGSVCWASA